LYNVVYQLKSLLIYFNVIMSVSFSIRVCFF